jgi:hypothetical protein
MEEIIALYLLSSKPLVKEKKKFLCAIDHGIFFSYNFTVALEGV